jgi:quinol monooxygenase YgiN
MVVIHVSAIVKDESARTFEQSLRSIIRDAKETKGCIKYEWFGDPDASDRYVIYGEFDSEENFDAYLKSSVVKRIGYS